MQDTYSIKGTVNEAIQIYRASTTISIGPKLDKESM